MAGEAKVPKKAAAPKKKLVLKEGEVFFNGKVFKAGDKLPDDLPAFTRESLKFHKMID